MERRFFLIAVLIVMAAITAACRPAVGPEVGTAVPVSIGEISRELDVVEHGPNAEELNRVEEPVTLNPGDSLRITQGGEALLDFGSFLRLRLFNDTQLSKIIAESAADTPLIARLVLERGGFTGNLTKAGKEARFQTPGGAEILVLGTTFFVVYDPKNGTTTVGNFDGVVGAVSGGQSESLSPGHFFSMPAGAPPGPEQPIPITLAEFNAAARELQSPIEVVDTLLNGTPTPTLSVTLSPSPTASQTQSATPTFTVTPSHTPVPLTPTNTPLACPPLITVLEPANCREGPGTNYDAITAFQPGISLTADGQSPFTPLWWWAEIPTGGHCWISDAVVAIEGDTSTSCVEIVAPPPTYTPTIPPSPTASSTWTPTACPNLGGLTLTVSKDPTRTVSWNSTGGCPPFGGTLTARYSGEDTPYDTYQVTTQSGSHNDEPPTRCEGTFTIEYTLTLYDSSGQVATTTTTSEITWIC